MAEVQEKVSEVQEKVQEKLCGTSGNTALKAAAAAATATAATYAVRKALSHEHNGSSDGHLAKKVSGSSSILASAAATSWSAASDVMLPLADDAAEAAGKYV